MSYKQKYTCLPWKNVYSTQSGVENMYIYFFLNDLVEVLQHLLKGYPELLAYSELETCLSLTS